jgi:hypothetical protein
MKWKDTIQQEIHAYRSMLKTLTLILPQKRNKNEEQEDGKE